MVAVAALTGTAEAAAPVRGAALCWDFDLPAGDGPDRVEGTAGPEHVAGYGGNDELILFGGDDCAATGAGHDVVHLGPGNDDGDAGSGADQVFGGPGNDVLVVGIGADSADGGDGDDLIRDERGDADPDVLIGGPGHDVIRAANFAADAVECGPGYDVAIVDPQDTVAGCDRVEVARSPRLVASALRTGVRPAFAVRWTRADLAPAARIAVTLVERPEPRAGCTVGGWRARGVAPLRLSWRGRTSACAGEYGFTLTWVGRREGAPPVACEVLAGTPASGCAPTERLGTVHVPVR